MAVQGQEFAVDKGSNTPEKASNINLDCKRKLFMDDDEQPAPIDARAVSMVMDGDGKQCAHDFLEPEAESEKSVSTPAADDDASAAQITSKTPQSKANQTKAPQVTPEKCEQHSKKESRRLLEEGKRLARE